MVVRDGGFLDITFPLTEPAPATHAPIEMERMLEDFPDPALCRCLIEEFFAQTQKLLEDLPEHLNSRDFSTVHRIAHTIKGGALNIHAPEISQTAKEFEHDAKARRLEKGLFYREKLLHELSAAVKYFKVTSQKEHRYEQ
jgi:HPt (histidine-containing phosphotransfer) domain-containing protein